MPGEIHEIARGRQHPFGPTHDLGADFSQGDFARPPLHQFDPEFLLEVADLHRQRRLGDRTSRRSAAEMAVLGQS